MPRATPEAPWCALPQPGPMGLCLRSYCGSRGPSLPSQALQLFVRHERTNTVDCPSDDVDALLVAAAAKTGVPRDAAWLSYGGKVLRAHRSLRSYGVAAGATVHLAVRGRGGVATFRMHGAYVRSSVRQDSARATANQPWWSPPGDHLVTTL